MNNTKNLFFEKEMCDFHLNDLNENELSEINGGDGSESIFYVLGYAIGVMMTKVAAMQNSLGMSPATVAL